MYGAKEHNLEVSESKNHLWGIRVTMVLRSFTKIEILSGLAGVHLNASQNDKLPQETHQDAFKCLSLDPEWQSEAIQTWV